MTNWKEYFFSFNQWVGYQKRLMIWIKAGLYAVGFCDFYEHQWNVNLYNAINKYFPLKKVENITVSL